MTAPESAAEALYLWYVSSSPTAFSWRELTAAQRDTWRDGAAAVLTVAQPRRVIELTGPEHLIAHIEGLQATLTKRNATIASLEEALALARGESAVEPSHPALKEAYRKGYEACRARVADAQREAARVASELTASLSRANITAYFNRDSALAEDVPA